MLTVGVPALGADLQLSTDDDQWVGLGQGHGVATGRRVLVELGGRRMPRPRRTTVWLPDAGGALAALDTNLDTTLDTVRSADPSLLAKWAN
jgi:hypothetical protein